MRDIASIIWKPLWIYPGKNIQEPVTPRMSGTVEPQDTFKICCELNVRTDLMQGMEAQLHTKILRHHMFQNYSAIFFVT